MQEPEAGYLYILQNESLPEDRLKIGRTHHDPTWRADDLSRSTGVPTPFSVLWSDFTDDCVEAERIVHQTLADYRTNPRREFFDVEATEAITAARDAIVRTRRYADWWDLATRGERTASAFCFHSLFRPIARLPVSMILLVAWIAWKAVVLAARVTRSALFLPFRAVGALFAPTR